MCDDEVLLYATEVLSLGLLWHGFHDAVKEADGDRIIIKLLKILTGFVQVNKSSQLFQRGSQPVAAVLLQAQRETESTAIIEPLCKYQRVTWL